MDALILFSFVMLFIDVWLAQIEFVSLVLFEYLFASWVLSFNFRIKLIYKISKFLNHKNKTEIISKYVLIYLKSNLLFIKLAFNFKNTNSDW